MAGRCSLIFSLPGLAKQKRLSVHYEVIASTFFVSLSHSHHEATDLSLGSVNRVRFARMTLWFQAEKP